MGVCAVTTATWNCGRNKRNRRYTLMNIATCKRPQRRSCDHRSPLCVNTEPVFSVHRKEIKKESYRRIWKEGVVRNPKLPLNDADGFFLFGNKAIIIILEIRNGQILNAGGMTQKRRLWNRSLWWHQAGEKEGKKRGGKKGRTCPRMTSKILAVESSLVKHVL